MKITSKIIGVEQDLQKEQKKIAHEVDRALVEVGVELKNDLQFFLKEVWYKGYDPVQYERRTDDNSLGTPLGDESNFDYWAVRQKLTFSYEPTGKHKEKEWSEREGDKLIEWIQSSHEIEDSYIPARPFWNDFLDAQMEGGLIEKFIKAMSSKYHVESEDSDNVDELSKEYIYQDYD